MGKALPIVLTVIISSVVQVTIADRRPPGARETVIVRSGSLSLHALVWRPEGRGPFPAVLFNHGSGRTSEEIDRLGAYEAQAPVLGPVFARHGYVFMYLFRRGVGLSSDQGENSVVLMNRELDAHGQEARNAIQLELLQTTEMSDAIAGLDSLRALPDVDPGNIALVGHPLGGSLTLLMAERDPRFKAIVVFSAAGWSWDRSAQLRDRLTAAAGRASAPVFFIHAANDYTVAPGEVLDAELARLGKPHRLEIYPSAGQ